MTNEQPPAAQADWAEAEAAKLPCYLRDGTRCTRDGRRHDHDCPAYHRPFIAAALREAEQRGRDQAAERLESAAEQLNRVASSVDGLIDSLLNVAGTIRQRRKKQ